MPADAPARGALPCARRARAVLQGALLAASLSHASAASSPGWYVGDWGHTYARYSPSAFGPERPLRELLAEEGIALSPQGGLEDARLLVIKDQRRCELWRGDRMIKAYRIQLSQRSTGTKRRRYDQRTPEGDYRICAHRPSRYHRGLWLDYPGLPDAERGLRDGIIGRAQRDAIASSIEHGACPPQNTRLGGAVILHGQQGSFTSSLRRAGRRGGRRPRAGLEPGDADPAEMRAFHDWTQGCIAFFNPDIRELFDLLPNGTPVKIVADGPLTLPPPSRAGSDRRR